MKILHVLGKRLASLRRGKFDSDLRDEYAFHLDMRIRDYVAEGMAPEAARKKAAKDFGNRRVLEEESRDLLSFPTLESVARDLKHALRTFGRNPGFTAMALVTLALGVGATVAIFSVIYGAMLRPLPYTDGEDLVVLHQEAPAAGLANIPFSVPEIVDYREMNTTLDAVVEHHSMNFLLFGRDRAERVDTAVVSANFFDVLGIAPRLGRTFVEADDIPSAEAVIVLSHEYWQTRHGADPEIVGKVFEMNDRSHRVIGVLPPFPEYPVVNDVYMPMSHCPWRSSEEFVTGREHRMMTVFARLKPGASLAEANADIGTISDRLEASYPEDYPPSRGYGAYATFLGDELSGNGETTFLILLATAGFVLLIACANVANMFLARMLNISRELSLRMALGAGRARVVRQVLTESMLLSLAGSLLAVPIALAAHLFLVDFASRFTTRAPEIQVDAPVLVFALLLSLSTGLVFGLGPALASSHNLGTPLSENPGRASVNRGTHRMRSGLVVAQVAISFALLIGAGLMGRSFMRLAQVDPGFDTSRLLTMRLSPNYTRISENDELIRLAEEVVRNVEAVPGVESAALTNSFPFRPDALANGPDAFGIEIVGQAETGRERSVDADLVTPRYFQTIGQRIVDGRGFRSTDDTNAPMVGVVNESMARSFWGDRSPVGRRVRAIQEEETIEVIGVVSDVREYGLDHPVVEKIYLPVAQLGFAGNLVIRTSAEPATVEHSIRSALLRVDPELAVDRVQTVEELRDESVASPRLLTFLIGAFAALALVISSSGIASMMTLMVSQRYKELGIRLTLGASPSSVLSTVVGHGMRLTVAGATIGLIGAIALGRLIESMLYETPPTDPATLLVVGGVFFAVAALACFVPARRATTIDPLVAIRHE